MLLLLVVVVLLLLTALWVAVGRSNGRAAAAAAAGETAGRALPAFAAATPSEAENTSNTRDPRGMPQGPIRQPQKFRLGALHASFYTKT